MRRGVCGTRRARDESAKSEVCVEQIFKAPVDTHGDGDTVYTDCEYRVRDNGVLRGRAQAGGVYRRDGVLATGACGGGGANPQLRGVGNPNRTVRSGRTQFGRRSRGVVRGRGNRLCGACQAKPSRQKHAHDNSRHVRPFGKFGRRNNRLRVLKTSHIGEFNVIKYTKRQGLCRF